jgi:hypothetical protein
MSNAPKRGRGRPAKYSKEEAQLQKREQDRLRAYNRVCQLPKVEVDPNPPQQVTPAARTDAAVLVVPPSRTILPKVEPTPLVVYDDNDDSN